MRTVFEIPVSPGLGGEEVLVQEHSMFSNIVQKVISNNGLKVSELLEVSLHVVTLYWYIVNS